MLWIKLDNEYYSTYPVKLPKGKTWTKDSVKFPVKDKDKKIKYVNNLSCNRYFYSNIYFFDAGCDLYILFSGRKLPKQYLTIKNYSERRANEILLDMFHYLGDSNPYPLGSHFEDGIFRFWKMKGLHF